MTYKPTKRTVGIVSILFGIFRRIDYTIGAGVAGVQFDEQYTKSTYFILWIIPVFSVTKPIKGKEK